MKKQIPLLLISFITVIAGYYSCDYFINDDKKAQKQEIPKAPLNIEEPKAITATEEIKTQPKIEKVVQTEIEEPKAKPIAKKPIPKKKAVIKPEVKKKKPAPKKAPVAKYAEIKFDSMIYNFGEINEGDVLDFKFKFTNTGKIPLDILEALATCGCTTPTVPFISTPPGESNVIGVRYNSVGKEGPQQPEITIRSNTNPAIHLIKLKGTVIAKEKEAKEDTETEETDDEKSTQTEDTPTKTDTATSPIKDVQPPTKKKRIKKDASMIIDDE